jgi:hypothetical protein
MDDFVTRMEEQFAELIVSRPLLRKEFSNGLFVIAGTYSLHEELEGEVYTDSFEIEILVDSNFPESVPIVSEKERRIRAVNFEHVNDDGTLCLEIDTKILIDLQENPTLQYFSEKYIRFYLLSFLYHRKHKKFPFGEYAHAEEGRLEYYGEIFDTTDKVAAKTLLTFIFKNEIKGHNPCPCGNGKKYRDCHRGQVHVLKESKYRSFYFKDYERLIAGGKNENNN